MRLPAIVTSVTVLVAATGATGCGRDAAAGGPTKPAQLPTDATLNRIPSGAPPGEPVSIASLIGNPYEGDAKAVQEGRQLFTQMNCVYCHGAEASGLMGPSLNNHGWLYGGTPAELYKSIHDGRPQGMPAWGSRLPSDQIWKLVAYIESLGGALPPATNKSVEAGGPQTSTTGPQPADQNPTDAAARSLAAGNGRRR